jgi:importin subunit alpha-2
MPISMEERQRGFKNKGKGMDECRRQRTNVSVEIRKARKDDQLTKKRQISSDMTMVSPLKENNQQTPTTVPPMSMEDIVQTLLRNDQKSSDEIIFSAVQSTRRLLSREKNPPIDKVIKAGLVPSLMNLLQYDSNTDIQFEAAWAVTNIASGTSEQTKTVVEAGCINHFRKLLMSSRLQVQEQAVWALGNIAGDGPEYRDLVIDCDCVRPLLNLIRTDIAVPFLRNVTWTLSNLCRNKNPPPDLNKIVDVLPVLANLIRYKDEEVVADTCWAFSYLTDGPNEKIARVISTEGVVPQLVSLLGHSNVSIVTPSLRTIGNIVTGDDTQTQLVIESGALKPLRNLLHHSKAQLVKEATWAISNIAAGTEKQIQMLIDEGG